MAEEYFPPPPSADVFAEVLSKEREWYTLGTFLDAPVQELADIEDKHRNASLLRRYIELHGCLKRGGKCLSWEHIVTCLRRMGNNDLAKEIRSLYIQPSLQPHATSSVMAVEDGKINIVAQQFLILRERFDWLITNRVKSAFRNSTASVEDVRELIEDKYGRNRIILQSTDERKQLDEVFVWLKDNCSFLHYGDLKYLVDNLPEKDLVLQNELSSFEEAVQHFKSSAEMLQFVDLIKEEQAIANNTKLVQLKVRKLWSKRTMKQFEIVVNELLFTYQMQIVGINHGCICASWVVPDHIDTNKLVPEPLPMDVVKFIGIIYLRIGDEVIFNFEGEAGCETIEAAMLQAIKLKNTRVIELLLAMGCSPEVATYNKDNAITTMVNIRERSSDNKDNAITTMIRERSSASSVHHVCILGHNEHVEAIVDSCREYECSSCGMKNAMIKQLHRSLRGLSREKGLPSPLKEEKWITTIDHLNRPFHIDARNEHIVVTEYYGQCVSVFNKEGMHIHTFGSKGNGPGEFHCPSGIALTEDNHIIVADKNNCRIQKFTIEGEFVEAVGSHGKGPLQFGVFSCGLSIHPRTGKIYVCDTDNHRIQVINSDFTFSHEFGSLGQRPGQFHRPYDVAFDDSLVYVVDKHNYRVQAFTLQGDYHSEFGSREQFKSAEGIAVDTNEGVVYVSDSQHHNISLFRTGTGEFIRSVGKPGNRAEIGTFTFPAGMAVGDEGTLYVCDRANYRLQIL